MKKYLFGSAIATLMLAACSDDQTVDAPASANEISFQASVENVSRANTEPGYPPSEFAVTAIGNDANFFSDLIISGSKAAPYRPVDGGIYHFPKYHLTFYGYTPVDFGGTAEINPESRKLTGVTVKDSPKEHIDLLVAEDNRDALGSTTNTVGMKFKHAMSEVVVKVRSSNPAMKYEVAGVRLASVKSTADFTYPELENSNELTLPASCWSAPTGPKTFQADRNSFQFFGSNGSTTAYEAMRTDWNNTFKIIPQNLSRSGAWSGGASADGAYISIKCKMWVHDPTKGTDTQFFPATGNKYGLAAVPLNINFEPGKKYVITVDMAGGGRVDPNPTAVTDSDIEPRPIPGKPGGTKIISGDVTFSVDINDFSNGGIQMISPFPTYGY